MTTVVFVDAKGAAQTFIGKDDRARTTVETTVFEMLAQRGYKVVGEADNILFAKRSLTDGVMVFFERQSGLTTDRIYKIMSRIRESGYTHCIIIYRDGVTTYVKNLIKNEIFDRPKPMRDVRDKSAYDLNEFDIEIFNEAEMRINITRHRLQPKRIECLSDADCAAFKKKYGVKIPVYAITDPIVRFFNFKKGSIVSLTRADGTHTYRIVR